VGRSPSWTSWATARCGSGRPTAREALSAAALYLGASSRLTVATGIASVYARDAVAAASAARALAEQYPGRFLLGLGVSHAPLVERLRGHAYGRPLTVMRDYLAAMDAAPYAVAGAGEPPPRVLAALGPRMLELARDRTAGAHPYLTTPAHTASARELLGPGPLLAVEQGVVLTADREVFLQRAHWHLEIYTGLASYRSSWLRQGFGEDDLGRGGSERLKDGLLAFGRDDLLRRVRAHLDAGADHVCVQVLGADPFDVPQREWRALAPDLLASVA